MLKTHTKYLKDLSHDKFSKKQRVQGNRCRDYKDKYKDIYKDKYIDKDKYKYKVHRRPNIRYVFEKQGVQGYQI